MDVGEFNYTTKESDMKSGSGCVSLIFGVEKCVTKWAIAMVCMKELEFWKVDQKVKKRLNWGIWRHFYGIGSMSWWLYGGVCYDRKSEIKGFYLRC